jgi:hypothetical protein
MENYRSQGERLTTTGWAKSFGISTDLAPLVIEGYDQPFPMWCRYIECRRRGPQAVPSDLLVGVLYQREYVFEWLDGNAGWDQVQCDT